MIINDIIWYYSVDKQPSEDKMFFMYYICKGEYGAIHYKLRPAYITKNLIHIYTKRDDRDLVDYYWTEHNTDIVDRITKNNYFYVRDITIITTKNIQ